MAVVALMGGSYNPVHIGHAMVAQYVALTCDGIDRVEMMLSPLNPLKTGAPDPASDADRLAMLSLVCKASHGLIALNTTELSMPRPCYTIDTLNRLADENPHNSYRLIIGSDNWNEFHRWRASDEIISRFGLIVYPRPGYPVKEVPEALQQQVRIVDAPTADISSTMLRDMLARGLQVNFFLPPGVYEYITAHGLYGTQSTESRPFCN